MTPYVDSYDKVTHDIGLCHVEWYQVGEVGDSAERAVQSRVARRNPIHSLAAWLTSQVHPASVPQVRQRHA